MSIEKFLSGFQNQDLKIPDEHYENVRRFVYRQSGGKSNRDDYPFDRFLDMWWLALCLGIKEGKRSKPVKWRKFVRAGEVMSATPHFLSQLQLLAINQTGDTEILFSPSEMIDLANEYAATGLPLIIDELLGKGIPIWAMTDYVEIQMKSD